MTILSSRSNPKVKQARALRQRKARQEAQLFLVEGIHHVGAAFEAHANIESIYYAPELLSSQYAHDLIEVMSAHGLPCFALTAEVFDSIASKENPQGILAVVHSREIPLQDLTPANFSWGVALVAPQDPGNLGTILRTIEAVGADGLLLLDSSVDPYHPSAVRASMGALFWRPLASATFGEFIRWARLHHYHLYGTSARGSIDYREVPEYTRPRILLMGSEREGLSQPQREACELLIRLPMQGRVSSLNLGVATGVMLYAMLARDQQ